MKTGIYALASLDLSPVLPQDLAAMGLEDCAVEAPSTCIHARVSDAEAIGAADVARHGDSWCYFVGELEDPATVAASLGCRQSPAAIALAAMQCWGAATTDRLAGEWSLLYWDGREKALWLGASRMLRDRIYFAFDGQRVGVSGDFTRLSCVHWIGAALDPQGVAYALSRPAVHERRARRTVFQNIYDLEQGTFHRFAAGGVHRVFHHAADVELSWEGSFGEAIAAIEDRLMRVVRASLSRHDRVVVLLSGGLDSAIVARFLAEARQPHQEVIALTAAAPPGSERNDERLLAGAVAEALGIEQRLVWPDESASIFRRASADLASGQLFLSPTHYLFDALIATARQLGATAIYDGVGGEMSVSGYAIRRSGRARLGALKRWMLDALPRRRTARTDIDQAFLIPPSPELLLRLPSGFGTGPHRRLPRPGFGRASATIGMPPGYHKPWRTPTSVADGGLRHVSPLRDRNLICMVAGMPRDYATWHGQNRALARALLRGHVPDHVTCQAKGMRFSVDYDDRFRREMPHLLERLPTWREAGMDEWLDLTWISDEVRALTTRTSIPTAVQFRLQMAALAAENLILRRGLSDASSRPGT